MKFYFWVVMFSLLSCLPVRAKEVTVVFDGAKDRFTNVDDNASRITKEGVNIVSQSGDWSGEGTEYRWYNSCTTTFSSVYPIKKIVFSAATKGGTKDCTQIVFAGDKIGKFSNSTDKKTLTWSYDMGIQKITCWRN